MVIKIHLHFPLIISIWKTSVGDNTRTYSVEMMIHGLTHSPKLSVNSWHFKASKMAVFSWGLGKSGQLGNGKLTNAELPQPLVIEKSSRLEKIDSIVGISAGGLFSCFVTRSGKVLSCGNGKYGRLGNSKEDDQKEACLVKDLTGVKVVQVFILILSTCVAGR